MTLITNVSGIGPGLAAALAKIGITTAEQFAAASVAQLTTIPGIGVLRAKALLAAASQFGEVSPAKAKPTKASPASEKVQLLLVPEIAGVSAAEKAATKKAKAKAKKKAAAKKAAKNMKTKEKAAIKKAAKEIKAIKKRAKKAVMIKKAKKAARKKLMAKADKKATRA